MNFSCVGYQDARHNTGRGEGRAEQLAWLEELNVKVIRLSITRNFETNVLLVTICGLSGSVSKYSKGPPTSTNQGNYSDS